MHNDIRYGPITINVIIIKAIKMLLLLHFIIIGNSVDLIVETKKS